MGDECKKEGKYTRAYEISSQPELGEENLFVKYKNHTQLMNAKMNDKQNDLLGILKKLFKFQAPEKKEEEAEKKEVADASAEVLEKAEKEQAPAAPAPAPAQAPAQAPAVPAQAPAPAQEGAPVPAVPEKEEGTEKKAPAAQAPAAQAPALEQAPAAQAPALEQAPAVQAPAAPQEVTENKVGGGDTNVIEDVKVILDPELDEDLLKSYVNSARQIIMTMYINCEKDFLAGIDIFESIIASTLGQTTTTKINKLNEKVLEIYANREER